MSSPSEHRCLHNRLHRHFNTVEVCEERQHTRDEAKRTKTPYPEFDLEPSTLEPAVRRRRERAVNTPTPRGETNGVESPSPLQSRSTNTGGGLFTPIETQEEDNIIQVASTPMASPASTQVVPETPFSQLRQQGPALGEAGPSNYFNPGFGQAPPSTNGSIEHNPGFNFRHTSLPTTATLDHIIPELGGVEQTIQNLRNSRNRLTRRLEESTASNERLREERQYLQGEVQRINTLLAQAERERDTAQAEGTEEPWMDKRPVAVLIFVLVLILAYTGWCRYMAAEMEYIRKRSFEVLTE